MRIEDMSMQLYISLHHRTGKYIHRGLVWIILGFTSIYSLMHHREFHWLDRYCMWHLLPQICCPRQCSLPIRWSISTHTGIWNWIYRSKSDIKRLFYSEAKHGLVICSDMIYITNAVRYTATCMFMYLNNTDGPWVTCRYAQSVSILQWFQCISDTNGGLWHTSCHVVVAIPFGPLCVAPISHGEVDQLGNVIKITGGTSYRS